MKPKTWGDVARELNVKQATIRYVCENFDVDFQYVGNYLDSSTPLETKFISHLLQNKKFIKEYEDDYYKDKTPKSISVIINREIAEIEKHLQTYNPEYFVDGKFTAKEKYSLRYVSSYYIDYKLGGEYEFSKQKGIKEDDVNKQSNNSINSEKEIAGHEDDLNKSYEELLQDERWRKKRRVILERDQNECQECANEKVKINANEGTLVSLEFKVNLTALFNAGDPRFRQDDAPKYSIIIAHNDSNEQITANLYMYDCHSEDVLSALKNVPVYYSIEEVTDEETQETNERIVINVIENHPGKQTKWFHVYNLHVHHRYYQDGKLPWEYPRAALITYCWRCHESLHENETVRWLDKNGKQKGVLTYCKRCHGAGEFPQYSHVDNGICFDCKGCRYMEFLP